MFGAHTCLSGCTILKVVASSVCVFLALKLWQYLKRPSNIPPGPLGWPYIGSILSAGNHIGRFFTELSKTYGKVFSVYIGSKLHVVINDAELAREAFLKQGEIFSGRPRAFFVDDLLQKLGYGHIKHAPGLAISEGRVWKEQRKFALTALREFGMGKVSMEEKIKEEIARFLNELKQKDGQPFNVRILMNNSISNVISSIILGRTYDYDNADFKLLMKCISEDSSNTLLQGVIEVFPWTRFLPFIRQSYDSFVKNQSLVFDFIVKTINEHIDSHDPETTRDFIDAYLSHMQQLNAQGVKDTTFNEFELSAVVFDLFFAGTETTATTLRWAFLFMMKHPEVMKKAQQEIDDVVGRSRMPTSSDRSNMPFVEACITETQRLGNIAPIAAPHLTSETCEFNGYTIPASTPIVFNLTGVLLDPEQFPEPNEFRPERHLDQSGQFVKNENLMPFSVGRRICLGESLARMEIFLYFTSILQHFNIQLPDGDTKLDLEPVVGFTASPKDYKMKITLR